MYFFFFKSIIITTRYIFRPSDQQIQVQVHQFSLSQASPANIISLVSRELISIVRLLGDGAARRDRADWSQHAARVYGLESRPASRRATTTFVPANVGVLPCLFSGVRAIMLPSSAEPFSRFSTICWRVGAHFFTSIDVFNLCVAICILIPKILPHFGCLHTESASAFAA